MTTRTPSISKAGDSAIIQLRWRVTRFGLLRRIPSGFIECLDGDKQTQWRIPLAFAGEALAVLASWHSNIDVDDALWDHIWFALQPVPAVTHLIQRHDCVCQDCGSRRVAMELAA